MAPVALSVACARWAAKRLGSPKFAWDGLSKAGRIERERAAAAGVACREASAAWGTELTPEKPEVTDAVDVERGGGGKVEGLRDGAPEAAADTDGMCG